MPKEPKGTRPEAARSESAQPEGARREGEPTSSPPSDGAREQMLDESLEETFPASDPPAHHH
jgi:hypothetical protein